jgi:adiponectin receptor
MPSIIAPGRTCSHERRYIPMSSSELGIRQRPTSAPTDPVIHARARKPNTADPFRRTLTYEQSLIDVPWQTDNRYIRTGYRRRMKNVGSALNSTFACKTLLQLGCLRLLIERQIGTTKQVSPLSGASLDQTQNGHLLRIVNIHSHSIGALFYSVLISLHFSTHHESFSKQMRNLPWLSSLFPSFFASEEHTHSMIDTLAITIFLIAAVACLSLSSWFHTVQCTSKERCDSAHRGDYVS